MLPLSYSARSLAARPFNTGLAALGVGTVVFAFSAMWMMASGAKKTSASSGSPANAIVMSSGALSELSSGMLEDDAHLIETAPQIMTRGDQRLVSREVVTVVNLEMPSGEILKAMVRGVDAPGWQVHDCIKVIEGRPFAAGKNEVIVGKALAKRLKSFGGTLPISSTRTVEITGVFTADGGSFESEIWGDLEVVRAIFFSSSTVSVMAVRLRDPGELDALRATLAGDRRLQMDVKRESDYYADQAREFADFVRFVALGIGLIFSFGATLGAMTTMYALIGRRMREIGTLRALGSDRNSVLGGFVVEALVLSLVGGLVGLLASLAMTLVKIEAVDARTSASTVLSFSLEPGVMVLSVLFAVIIGILSGFFPALYASRISPVKAMRG